ncbi:hypothetical protein BDA96_07G229400 [Sorghum bicolor]|jgi:hypothetical protein|uniref:Uncharacterized protein n=1 Tax=Sorghum bicolor TaxID=4558 RepID=A0A921QMB9_SORBI|nr:hypothetical protein BDA96_07G229400 [Sorghum bicolor]
MILKQLGLLLVFIALPSFCFKNLRKMGWWLVIRAICVFLPHTQIVVDEDAYISNIQPEFNASCTNWTWELLQVFFGISSEIQDGSTLYK